MSETVFILGAGASKEAGAPLVADFIDVAERVWEEVGRDDPREPHFAAFFQAIGDLQAVHSKAHLDISSIEEVFAAIEMAQTLGTFGDYSQEQLDALLISTRHVIAATLDWTTRFGLHEGPPSVVTPSEPYVSFNSLINSLEGNRDPGETYREEDTRPPQLVTVITLNYDLALDFALGFEGTLDYALETDEPRPTTVLKLHGSLNWGRCQECNVIVAVHVYPEGYMKSTRWRDNLLNSHEMMSKQEHCPGRPLEHPMIIPPTWNKAQYRRQFDRVWKCAAKRLSTAHRIVVIGYSLPPSDVFMKYLYAIGATGRTHLRRFIVIDPDDTGTVESRFRSLIGPSAEQCFEYRQQTFGDGLNTLAEEIADRTF